MDLVAKWWWCAVSAVQERREYSNRIKWQIVCFRRGLSIMQMPLLALPHRWWLMDFLCRFVYHEFNMSWSILTAHTWSFEYESGEMKQAYRGYGSQDERRKANLHCMNGRTNEVIRKRYSVKDPQQYSLWINSQSFAFKSDWVELQILHELKMWRSTYVFEIMKIIFLWHNK